MVYLLNGKNKEGDHTWTLSQLSRGQTSSISIIMGASTCQELRGFKDWVNEDVYYGSIRKFDLVLWK